MTDQTENSPRQISDRVIALLKLIDVFKFTQCEVVDLYIELTKKFEYVIDSYIKQNYESTHDDPEPFHGDGYDRYVENLIQDIQDEQENSVDDLA